MKSTKSKFLCSLIAFTVFIVSIPMAKLVVASAQDSSPNKISNYKTIQNTLDTMRFPDDIYISFLQSEVNKSKEERTITIELAGMSAFISFDKSVIAENVTYESSDNNIVFPDDGRILALKTGEALIKVGYEGYSETIRVVVEKEFDQSAYKSFLNVSGEEKIGTMAADPNNDARMAITAKARAMVYQAWRPAKNLVKWGELSATWKYFEKDVIQFGLPYTQAIQVDEISFLNKMTSASDFYTPNQSINTGTKKVAPQYGNDCSGFVSFSWGITRINTTAFIDRINKGTYRRLSKYSELRSGDAVVVSGHMFLIANNFEIPSQGSSIKESYVACHEQTPPYARDTFWTYAQLQSKGYIPFSKFK